jgi:hypothetical protein
MAMRFSEQRTASGLRYLRIDVSGQVDLEQAKQFEAYVKRPEWRNGAFLSVVAKGTDYAPEARKLFPSLRADVGALATVVTSPILRAAINMMERLAHVQGDSPLRMFNDEAEAIAWLETRAAHRRS